VISLVCGHGDQCTNVQSRQPLPAFVANTTSSCAITEVAITVGANPLRFTGFGSQAILYNYQSVVVGLLADDLAALKHAVENAPLRLDTKHRQDLTLALGSFLTSEVNLDIHDDQKRNAHLRDGVISQDYVDRALSLIRRALWRLYFAEMIYSLAVTPTLPALALLAGSLAHASAQLGDWVAPLIIACGVIPQLMFERRARNRLIASLLPNNGDTLRLLYSKHYIAWRFRALALAGAILLIAVTSVLLDQFGRTAASGG
jgi:hypothetical protein